MRKGIESSKMIALVALFAALNVITDSFGGLPSSGVWFSWNFMISPLTGIILGPLFGFAASFIGVMLGHYVYFQGPFEFLFTIGAPVGTVVSALIFRGKWKPVLLYFVALFAAYFATPVAWQLPLWGMWDVYLAFIALIVAVTMISKGQWTLGGGRSTGALAFAAFIGLEADILFRIFLLIPCQTYRLFFDVATLQAIWGSGALLTPMKAASATIVTVAVGVPLIKSLRNLRNSGIQV